MAEALERYDGVSQKLGGEFKAELRRLIAVAAAGPGRFHLLKAGFRRANLDLSTIVTNDLDGNRRPMDGNWDGVAVFDMGAYEHNPQTAGSNADTLPAASPRTSTAAIHRPKPPGKPRSTDALGKSKPARFRASPPE